MVVFFVALGSNLGLLLLFGYALWVHEQERERWMRLLSVQLGMPVTTISEPRPTEPVHPAQPRQVHKLSIPVPRGAMPRPAAVGEKNA